MKTIYLKNNPLINGRKSLLHIKVTKNAALDISDDAINIVNFDDEAEYYDYIADALKRDGLIYIESTKKEFDDAFINVVTEINDISKL